jgi:glycosyltransferase involved in cell wall biosynthesis
MAHVSPTVTVVVPAYNAERYIMQAVASVLGQSLPELEVIVVDDGSTDGTRAVLTQVADPRFSVIADSNHGPAHARNQGCRAASPGSRYIAFLDADDWWDADKLREQVHFLEQHPELAAAGSFMRYV